MKWIPQPVFFLADIFPKELIIRGCEQESW
jgi:hypothetical protein